MGFLQGGFFLRKNPLDDCVFGVHLLWFRYSHEDISDALAGRDNLLANLCRRCRLLPRIDANRKITSSDIVGSNEFVAFQKALNSRDNFALAAPTAMAPKQFIAM